MSKKYLDTKAGSLESAVLEAVSPAQQAAIAISKKQKAGKPGYDDKGKSLKNDVETDEELSAKQKKIDLNKNGKVDGDDLKKLRAKADKKEETVVEKTEYVEYKFKNKNDAMAAKKYFDGIQLMSFDVNDDGASSGELAVDAGNKDMTKYHKEIMKKFRGVKVVTTEKKEIDEGKMKDMAMKIDDIVAKMKKDSKMKSFADKFKADAMKSMDISKSLEKVLPDYVAGKDIQKLMASYEEVQEETLAMRAAKSISDMWAEASKSPKEEEEETPKKKESKKTTMTGKPMPEVEINPKSEEK